MDEFIFRGSQKLENFQYHLGQAANEGKTAIFAASKQTKDAISTYVNNTPSIQIQESIKELWAYLVNLAHDLNYVILRQIDASKIYKNITKIFHGKWDKREMCFCCIGLVVGGIIGYGIGKSVNRNNPTALHYMQAVQCTNYSNIEEVAVAEDAIAQTECGANEVRISVKAASVHILDADMCRGYGRTLRRFLSKYTKHSKHDVPFTLGRDCTGIVTDIGQCIKRLEVGDEVWVTVPIWQPGLMSQVVLVSERHVARKPRSIGFEGACSLPHAGCVALEALDNVDLNAYNTLGKRVFVNGGCTPVGCILIQVLKEWNADVTTSCFKKALPVAKALGAKEIITLDDPNGAAKTQIGNTLKKELALKDRFDVIINTLECGLGMHDFYDNCSATGCVVSTLPKSLDSDGYGFVMRGVFWVYLTIKCSMQQIFGGELGNFGETQTCYHSLDRLAEFVESGQLQTVVDKVFHPHDIERALHHIQSLESIGSTVVTFR